MKITVLDVVHCKADRELIRSIAPCLEFRRTVWIQGAFAKRAESKPAYMIDRRTGIFLTGLLPRVRNFLDMKKVSYTLEDGAERFEGCPELTKLEGITFRPDQRELINAALEKQRGVIKAPTGSGKTLLAAAIMKGFPKAKILFLCHNLSILRQTAKEFMRFGFSISTYTGEEKNLGGRVVLATHQSISKMSGEEFCTIFDVTIIDECHHCNSIKSNYGQIMQTNLSPIRLGLTATLPDSRSRDKQLALEGLIGPVIGEFTIEEGVRQKILATPKITLVAVPFNSATALNCKRFGEFYDQGIVNNINRNRLIVSRIKSRANDGKTSLILVKKIEHGTNLLDMTRRIGLSTIFVQGSTESEEREQIKEALSQKKIHAAISTAVWKEGINIPSLDVVINARGGKSEIETLQSIGRGLRTTESKTTVEIIDFLDPYRYLAEHTIERLSVYVKYDWL